MRIYCVSGYDWSEYKSYAPDFKDGDCFYTIYSNKIIAVTINNSYLKFVSSSEFVLYAKFKTPFGNTHIDKDGTLRITNDNTIILRIENTEFPVYNTPQDAKNNVKSTKCIDISKYQVINKGYEYAIVQSSGWNYYVNVYYWTYNTISLVPIKCFIKANSFIWHENSLLLAKDGIQIPDKTWESKQEVLDYLSNKNKNLEVVSFNDIDTKPEVKTFNINIEVNTNMSAKEITEVVLEKLSKNIK